MCSLHREMSKVSHIVERLDNGFKEKRWGRREIKEDGEWQQHGRRACYCSGEFRGEFSTTMEPIVALPWWSLGRSRWEAWGAACGALCVCFFLKR